MGVFYQKLTSQSSPFLRWRQNEAAPYCWGSTHVILISEGSFHWAGEDKSRGSHPLISVCAAQHHLGIVRNINSQAPPQPYRKAALGVGPAVRLIQQALQGILMHLHV